MMDDELENNHIDDEEYNQFYKKWKAFGLKDEAIEMRWQARKLLDKIDSKGRKKLKKKKLMRK